MTYRLYALFRTANTIVLAAGLDDHDTGIRQVAALSGRFAYLLICLTMCWGVLTATGWVRKATGHQALRGSHSMLAASTVTFACVHAAAFVFLDQQLLTGLQFFVPFLDGLYRHAAGIIALELLIAITITAGMHRFFRYRTWLRFHQIAYVAFALAILHSWLGTWYNSDFGSVWLAGITVTAPAVTMIFLRFAPPRLLIRAGLIDGEIEVSTHIAKNTQLQVSVDNRRCHSYAFCQAEAPNVFQLREDGRLQYRQHPELAENQNVHSAARACPLRAIQVKRADQ